MPTSPFGTRPRLPILALMAASLGLALVGSSPTAGGERTIIAESRFDVTNAVQQAELVQLVVDFSPGAWTSWHTHGGQAINLVLEGEITLRHPGMQHTYRAGEAWTDNTVQVHAAGNTGSGKARLLTNFILPPGAPQTTAVQDSPFEPTIVHAASFPLSALPAETQIVQQVLDLLTGWRTRETLAGFAANMTLAGQVTYTIGSEFKVYKAGDAWSAPAGTALEEENSSAATARVFRTSLLPKAAGR